MRADVDRGRNADPTFGGKGGRTPAPVTGIDPDGYPPNPNPWTVVETSS
jgi:hypothetical protein